MHFYSSLYKFFIYSYDCCVELLKMKILLIIVFTICLQNICCSDFRLNLEFDSFQLNLPLIQNLLSRLITIRVSVDCLDKIAEDNILCTEQSKSNWTGEPDEIKAFCCSIWDQVECIFQVCAIL